MKRGHVVIGLALLVLGAAALYLFAAGGRTPPGQPPLSRITIENVPQFSGAFNRAGDRVRVLLLLSPT